MLCVLSGYQGTRSLCAAKTHCSLKNVVIAYHDLLINTFLNKIFDPSLSEHSTEKINIHSLSV